MKNDQIIKLDSVKYNLCSDESEFAFTYSINECAISDAGQYSFVATNTFGKAVLPVRLLVKCIFFLIFIFKVLQNENNPFRI
jgi:hypothetical protein